MSGARPHVFLDLDGTLMDSAPGIARSIAHALSEIGHPVPDEAALRALIGPSLWEIFGALGVDPALHDAAIAHYRARYTTVGLTEASVYAGVPEMLTALGKAGAVLCLATAKPITYAAKITAHFGLAPHLAHEFGSELDGTRTNKADLIAYALAETGARADAALMVGDRRQDMIGALANTVTPIGAAWGYGEPGELTGAGCTRIAANPADATRQILEVLG